uniref:BAHD acyltransferase-like 05 n=1 Tax=Taxus x media TaxID=85957 RepID=A0A515L527_9CONI|nr:BAHD acyltransferase-like 05 [Taxus x media]
MENPSSTDFLVKKFDPVVVAPSLPLPKTTLQLSPIDNQIGFRGFFNSLSVYNAPDDISADPVKIIREALSKVLVHYFPLAGRFRNKENGELEVDCTGEGALFVEAMVEDNISVLRDFDDLNPSFQQLAFWPPMGANIEDLHLLVVQVTRFTCGAITVGVTVCHSIFDGCGAAQFVTALADMARGEVKPLLEPIWNRELLKPEDPVHLQLYQFDSLCPPPILFEELGQASLIINSNTIKYMKQCIMEECKVFCSTFEVMAALVWVARTKAFQIPHTENVKLLFAMDMRRSFNPPFPNGYYGNAIGTAYAMDNVEDLLNGSLSRVVMIIKKSKVSLRDNYLRSNKVKDPYSLDVNKKDNNVLALSDWRRLGFHEANFGWGDPVNVTAPQLLGKGLPLLSYYLFLQPSKNQPDGIKILMSCMHPSAVKSIKMEMEAMINKFVTKS